jgi:hypothetical protein
MMRTFRLPDLPKALAEVTDRLHLTPLIRAMSSPHDLFVLVGGRKRPLSMRSSIFRARGRRFRPCPGARRRQHGGPSFLHGLRGAGCNLEGEEKVLLHENVRKVHSVLAGPNRPLVLAAAEPLASMFRSVNSYPSLGNQMIEGNPDLMTDAELEDPRFRFLTVSLPSS